jgi:hypothetical protein
MIAKYFLNKKISVEDSKQVLYSTTEDGHSTERTVVACEVHDIILKSDCVDSVSTYYTAQRHPNPNKEKILAFQK